MSFRDTFPNYSKSQLVFSPIFVSFHKIAPFVFLNVPMLLKKDTQQKSKFSTSDNKHGCYGNNYDFWCEEDKKAGEFEM